MSVGFYLDWLLDCTGAEYNRLDKALNVVYKKLMKSMDKGDQEKLRQAQRTWLKYREINSAYIQSQGGTMASIEANSWELEELARRVHFLQGEWQKINNIHFNAENEIALD